MAEVKPSYDTKRQRLSEVIPLDSPLSMYVEPTRTCNFKCFTVCTAPEESREACWKRPASGWPTWTWSFMKSWSGKSWRSPRPSSGYAFLAWASR